MLTMMSEAVVIVHEYQGPGNREKSGPDNRVMTASRQTELSRRNELVAGAPLSPNICVADFLA